MTAAWWRKLRYLMSRERRGLQLARAIVSGKLRLAIDEHGDIVQAPPIPRVRTVRRRGSR